METVQRVRAALRGEPVDRPPYSFWTHLPEIDRNPEKLAFETAEFCARYDLDFIKTMPNGLYAVEDWGCVADHSAVRDGGVSAVLRAAVTSPQDWDRLDEIDVSAGSLGRELDHFARLLKIVGPSVPVLATVFSPLTIASKLSNGAYRQHLGDDPASVARGLEIITATTCAFVREAIGRGCAGVFLATQEATSNVLDECVYRRLGEPFDRRVIECATAAGGWFNVIHMHGENVFFELLAGYDVSALNWHIGEAQPAIHAYRANGGARPILGGLRRDRFTRCDTAGLLSDIECAMTESDGLGILLAPACVIRHPVDNDVLRFAADAIKGLACR
jgi:uroporphyrinogen decarboxylase